MVIRFFSQSKTHSEFSNFAPFGIDLDGEHWPSVEHYYQAQKFTDADLQRTIGNAAKPAIAKSLADKNKAAIRPDWDAVKDEIMERAVRRKFELHGELRDLLLATGDEAIVEAAPSDYYWGVGRDGTGANKLGRIIERIRDDLCVGGAGQAVIMWRATVLTIFPDMFPGPLGVSLAGRALATGVWALDTIDIRSHAHDKHRSVDDTPAGGGPGMVMKADVLARAIDAATGAGDNRPRLLMSPRGVPLTQARVEMLANGPGALVVCGRFEGVDERVIAGRQLEEISVGDFVLSGGETAAFALIEACVRLLPGVMGKAASAAEESFSAGLLEYPQYTRPAVWEGRAIPDVLTSGDHAKVAAFRRAEAERLTRERRPDLWAKCIARGPEGE
jgi:tRNA (guanine37-N1)-methyltransferase